MRRDFVMIGARECRSSLRELTRLSRDIVMSAMIIVPISISLFGSVPSVAQETRTIDDFVWRKDKSTGLEVAASRSDASFNFFDVGDLSYYSMYLVEQDLGRLAAAAGLTIERGPQKGSSVSIVHDTKVFSRLKNDKQSFRALGFPDDIIGMLEQRASDDAKCVTMTLTDDKNNIITTIVLLSEKFDGCLGAALLASLGVVASDIGIKALVSACVLYEARRLDLRDRQSLSREAPRLRDLCLTKAGENK